MIKTDTSIELRGVKINNLKNINIDIPLYKLTAITGVSGSGKSSLVFEGLYSEAYRRYLESLSSFARQYLETAPKPEIDSVSNLPAAVAVMQSRSRANSRSTVGTLTEINDHLKEVFTHLAKTICSKCKAEVISYSIPSTIEVLLDRYKEEHCVVLASMEKYSKIKKSELKELLIAQGFQRIWHEGHGTLKLEEIKLRSFKDCFIVVDRLKITKKNSARLYDGLSLAANANKNNFHILINQETKPQLLAFPTRPQCQNCLKLYPSKTSSLFSFNHPKGSCETCQGFGLASVIDFEKSIPDMNASLAEQGVAPWKFGSTEKYYKWVFKEAKAFGLDINKPFKKYNKAELAWLKEGNGDSFDGIQGFFDWLDTKKYKMHYRIHAARYRKYITCPKCHGTRFKSDSLIFQVENLNFAEVLDLPIERLKKFIHDVTRKASSSSNFKPLKEALKEIDSKLDYMIMVGLKYLSLNRHSRSLSGGEYQRMNMARCLGNRLTDTLYCLDEPTTGLHPRDTQNLIKVLKMIRDLGNTVVVVEHERMVIDSADKKLTIGPKAGHLGGYLLDEKKIPKKNLPPIRVNKFFEKNPFKNGYIELKNIDIHNLKKVNVKIPLGGIIGICGVSGSGKSSLISQSLYPSLEKFFKNHGLPKECKHKKLENYSDAVLLNQGHIGRSSRSNIATYLGIYDEIRKIFANCCPKGSKLTPGSFSFNTPGGRCENCKGLGTVEEDLSFLGNVETTCPDCLGRRFETKVLGIYFNSKNIYEALSLTIDEAYGFFGENSKISKKLHSVIQTGLGYVTLGQSTSTFSGGEAQRLKLLSFLFDIKKNKSSILILDEPSSGLSDYDVLNFINQIKYLSRQGHTIIVIEHHTHILKSCDWLIELGPDAGDGGGEIIYSGTPQDVLSSTNSVIRNYF